MASIAARSWSPTYRGQKGDKKNPKASTATSQSRGIRQLLTQGMAGRANILLSQICSAHQVNRRRFRRRDEPPNGVDTANAMSRRPHRARHLLFEQCHLARTTSNSNKLSKVEHKRMGWRLDIKCHHHRGGRYYLLRFNKPYLKTMVRNTGSKRK